MNQELTLTDVEQAVLRFIRLNPGLSRVEIAGRLGLSKSMLSKAVGTFEQTNLVAAERSKPGEGERGQPPIKLSLNDSAFHSIGVYVTRQHCVTVLSDLGGRSKRCIARKGPFTGIVERVVSDIGELLAASDAPVIGIGQSVPAIVRDDGSLFEIVPSQAGLPLMEIAAAIRATFGLPHFWENAAYCAAGYEAHKPDGNRRCVFHLTLDYGVGGGLVMDGRIFRGAYNQAANFGALIPETGPRPNLTDLARHLGVPIEMLDESFIATLHDSGDPALLQWIGDRGRRLSEPLSSVVQLFNPDTIVVGGFLPRTVIEALLAVVSLDAYDIANRRPVLKPALCVSELLGPQGFAQAAALLPIGAQLMGLRVSAPPP